MIKRRKVTYTGYLSIIKYHGSSEPKDGQQQKIQKLQCRGVEFRNAKRHAFSKEGYPISLEFCVTSLVIWFVVGVGSLQRNMGSSSRRTQIQMNVHMHISLLYLQSKMTFQ